MRKLKDYLIYPTTGTVHDQTLSQTHTHKHTCMKSMKMQNQTDYSLQLRYSRNFTKLQTSNFKVNLHWCQKIEIHA